MRTLKEILIDVLNATKTHEVDSLIRELVDDHNASWKPVGNRENNLQTLYINTDSAKSLIERVTNAIDAVLEVGKAEHPNDNCRSPREAAERWFGIPVDGGLSKVTVHRRQELANLITVRMQDGDSRNTPTIDVIDLGCGLSADDFPRTILSLNENNKISRFYTCGIFGQGGSTTLSFCRKAAFVSRPQGKNNETIAFTIAQLNEKDPNVYKQGSYEYLFSQVTGKVFEVPVQEPSDPFPSGTLVRHIDYQFDGYAGKFAPNLNNLYGITHCLLFNPVLPFWIEDNRHGADPNTRHRVIIGSRNRLLKNMTEQASEDDESLEIVHNDCGYHSFGSDGRIHFEYWVLDPHRKKAKEGKRSPSPVRDFVEPKTPILLTLNGQQQTALSVQFIKRDAELPSIASRIIFHGSCDDMEAKGKRELFTSNRETPRRTSLFTQIEKEIVAILKEDPDLRILEEEALQAQQKQMNEEEEKQVKQEVQKILGEMLPGQKIEFGPVADIFTQPTATVQSTRTRHQEIDIVRYKAPPIPSQDPPTYVTIVNTDPIRIWSGKRLVLRVETDAEDRLSQNVKLFIPVDSGLVESGHTPLKGGRMRFILAVKEGSAIPPDKLLVEVVIELRPPTTTVLSDRRTIEIVPPPMPEAKGVVRLPDFDPVEVKEGEDKWNDLEWNIEAGISQVEISGGKCLVYWSGSFVELSRTCEGLQRQDPLLVQRLRTLYQAWICAHALLQHYNEKQEDDEKSQLILEREKLRAAKLVLRLLEERVRSEWQATKQAELEVA